MDELKNQEITAAEFLIRSSQGLGGSRNQSIAMEFRAKQLLTEIESAWERGQQIFGCIEYNFRQARYSELYLKEMGYDIELIEHDAPTGEVVCDGPVIECLSVLIVKRGASPEWFTHYVDPVETEAV